MYSIRIRTNKRLDDYRQGDRTTIGVLMRSGQLRYYYWGGFTLEMKRPVKLNVEAFTRESGWDPRNPRAKMPQWQHLDPGEYLLGSYDNDLVYTYLPFTVVKGLVLKA